MDKQLSRNLRNIVFERDSYTCILCTAAPTELHHVVPRSRGGNDSPYNLVSVCRVCHELLHGVKFAEIEISTREIKQLALEYIQDLYAGDFRAYGSLFLTKRDKSFKK